MRKPSPVTAKPTEAVVASDQLAALVFDQIQLAAQPTAVAKGIENLVAVDEGSLGDLPWFHHNGLNFNASTYNWLNNLFAYDSAGYVSTNGGALTTAYFNVLDDIAYVLDDADAAKLNNANDANAAVANTVLTDFASMVGPVTGTTQVQQLTYVMTQVLSWGNPGLTLGQFRNSTNPLALLPNIPLGASQVVSDVVTYLAKTSSVANIQAAVASQNNQLSQTRNNVNPPVPPASAGPGFMTTIADNNATQIVPAITITESTGVIQNNLLPGSGTGTSFSAQYTATSADQHSMQLSVQGSGSAAGDADFFLSFGASASVSYNLFQFVSDLTTCQITLTFNGVTTFTTVFAAYDLSTGTGWWNPNPIQQAANPAANESGYQFTPMPPYNFAKDGSFGAIARLLISQQPVISLTYTTSHFGQMQSIFQETVSWGVSFCGISLGGGSQSYYQSDLVQHSDGQTVTLTMTPVGNVTPVSPADQLAYVVGAEIMWPGSSTN
jgi:hypothetical protein